MRGNYEIIVLGAGYVLLYLIGNRRRCQPDESAPRGNTSSHGWQILGLALFHPPPDPPYGSLQDALGYIVAVMMQNSAARSRSTRTITVRRDDCRANTWYYVVMVSLMGSRWMMTYVYL